MGSVEGSLAPAGHRHKVTAPLIHTNTNTNFIPMPISCQYQYQFHTNANFIPIPISYQYQFHTNTKTKTNNNFKPILYHTNTISHLIPANFQLRLQLYTSPLSVSRSVGRSQFRTRTSVAWSLRACYMFIIFSSFSFLEAFNFFVS